MHDGSLIADSGPLLGLALVDCVRHLKRMYSAVLVPQAVVDEIAGQGVFRRASDLFVREKWIHVCPVSSPQAELMPVFLGQGEVEVIRLGIEQPGSRLLIDDYRARRTAEALGLKCTGAAGVLVRAKRLGLVEHIRPLLLSMRENGYYIGDSVVQAACQHVGE
jgi:predicted nucleic acid-binding protein